MSSVGEEFPKEQARVRELLSAYKSIGPQGAFGAMMIGQVLARAEKAAISGNLPNIIRAYEELKGCE